MSGVLFIITIPTERYERQQEQSKTIPFNSESAQTLNNYESARNSSDENLIPKTPPESVSITVNIDQPIPDENAPSTSQSPELVKLRKHPMSLLEQYGSNSNQQNVQRTQGESQRKMDELMDGENGSSMERIMTEILNKLRIENAVWHLSRNTNYYQITFVMESNYRHELVLSVLNEWGIGQRNGSSMSMIPCPIHSEVPDRVATNIHSNSTNDHKQGAWNRFMNSVRARWNVAQIVQKVRQDATLTFDFVTLVFVAGTLASFGLIENSTTCLASSMLISPLMGPIIATIFGIVIKDNSLLRFGLINELIGILMATAVGFIFGLIISVIDSKYEYGSEQVLTKEMIDRCNTHSLLIGVFTALPSGAAVAIAILGENIGSLVGVAISASLLPPAVHSGVLWSLSVLSLIHADDETRFSQILSTAYYSSNQTVELAAYGAISLLLTLINVICILVMGVLILKIKEVAPITTRNQKQLWKHDIKIARDYNKTNNAEDDKRTRRLADELSDLELSNEMLRNLYSASYNNTWSPISVQQYFGRQSTSISDQNNTSMNASTVMPNQSLFRATPKYRPPIAKISNSNGNNFNSRRATLPGNSVPAVNAFRSKYFEKISEINYPSDGSKYVGIEPLAQSSSESDSSRSPLTKKFTVTPADLDKLP